jgi:steroid delta-isomerase-like uncharacterized protein
MTHSPTAPERQAVSTTDLALEYLEAAWNRVDLAALDALARGDLEVSYPLMPEVVRGREAFKQVLTSMQAGLPDLHFAFRHVATEDDVAVFSWNAAGTHTGPLLGIPPTGQVVQWSGLSVVEIADGRVTREWGEENALSLFRQLGVVRG